MRLLLVDTSIVTKTKTLMQINEIERSLAMGEGVVLTYHDKLNQGWQEYVKSKCNQGIGIYNLERNKDPKSKTLFVGMLLRYEEVRRV